VTRVKICGCRTPADAIAAAEAGADFVGLMFAESRRRVTVDEGAAIVRALGAPASRQEQVLPPNAYAKEGGVGAASWFSQGAAALDRLLARKRPLTVGVFANADPEEIDEIADETGLDLIQLAGGEPWGLCLLANRQVIKVVHVADGETSSQLIDRIETGSAVAVMLDRARSGADFDPIGPGGGSRFGGGGITIDWTLAASFGNTMPFWLAGGLDAANVTAAIGVAQPWCVDVSSGVETGGLKDHAKIRDFVTAAKAAGR
jgi:phosphoribosylanthranilate isomerase